MPHITIPGAEIIRLCRRWKIRELALFGSVLRDDFRSDSDVDVMVSFSPETQLSLFDMSHLQTELEAILGRPVDLVRREVIERSENYLRRKHILNSVEPIYVER